MRIQIPQTVLDVLEAAMKGLVEAGAVARSVAEVQAGVVELDLLWMVPVIILWRKEHWNQSHPMILDLGTLQYQKQTQ